MYDLIKSDGAIQLKSEIIVRFLSTHPGWKESNFQVLTDLFIKDSQSHDEHNSSTSSFKRHF